MGDISIHKLKNGLNVIFDESANETAAVDFYVPAGTRDETPEQNGVAHFLEHMSFKSTMDHTTEQLAAAIEEAGIAPNAHTSYEETCYKMFGLPEEIPAMVDYLGEMLFRSNWTDEEFETERGVVIQEIGSYDEEGESVASDAAQALAYTGQAIGRTVLGPKENIASMPMDTLKQFKRDHYGSMIVSIAGAIPDKSRILDRLEQATSGVTFTDPKSRPEPQWVGGQKHVTMPGDKVHFQIGFKAAPKYSDEAAAELVLGHILGGGMSSRLFIEVREKRGLVYSVSAGTLSGVDSGQLVIAGNTAGHIDETAGIIATELRRIASEPVTEVELRKARNAVKLSLAARNDSVSSRAQGNARSFAEAGRIRSRDEFQGAIDRVTAQDVMDAARRVFFSGTAPVVASAGPGERVPSLEAFAQEFSRGTAGLPPAAEQDNRPVAAPQRGPQNPPAFDAA